jgi:hypothetical protein
VKGESRPSPSFFLSLIFWQSNLIPANLLQPLTWRKRSSSQELVSQEPSVLGVVWGIGLSLLKFNKKVSLYKLTTPSLPNSS